MTLSVELEALKRISKKRTVGCNLTGKPVKLACPECAKFVSPSSFFEVMAHEIKGNDTLCAGSGALPWFFVTECPICCQQLQFRLRNRMLSSNKTVITTRYPVHSHDGKHCTGCFKTARFSYDPKTASVEIIGGFEALTPNIDRCFLLSFCTPDPAVVFYEFARTAVPKLDNLPPGGLDAVQIVIDGVLWRVAELAGGHIENHSVHYGDVTLRNNQGHTVTIQLLSRE